MWTWWITLSFLTGHLNSKKQENICQYILDGEGREEGRREQRKQKSQMRNSAEWQTYKYWLLWRISTVAFFWMLLPDSQLKKSHEKKKHPQMLEKNTSILLKKKTLHEKIAHFLKYKNEFMGKLFKNIRSK